MAPKLGDLAANISTLVKLTTRAFAEGADIVVAPELATTGFSISPDQAKTQLGMREPFTQLAELRRLAIANHGFVVVGVAELGDHDAVYNSAVMLLPSGHEIVQRKRGKTGDGWTRGDTPFVPIPSPFGELGMVVCSDTFLMDWPRILALSGVDILLSPANWWGDSGQLDIWATRVIENDLAIVVANRWGSETDTRFTPSYFYDMNDAPSAIMTPGDDNAKIVLMHRADQIPAPKDEVLHATINVPQSRIGSTSATAWPIAAREPAAYAAIADRYYRPDLSPDYGGEKAPGLPLAGPVVLVDLAFRPSFDVGGNIKLIISELTRTQAAHPKIDLVLLPARAITAQPVDTNNPAWMVGSPWSDLQDAVDRLGIEALVTSLVEAKNGTHDIRDSVVILRPRQAPALQSSLHAWPPAASSPLAPMIVDMTHARISAVLDRDMLVPETSLALAKAGADIVLVPAGNSGDPHATANSRMNWPYDVWRTRIGDGVHIAVSSGAGTGIVLRNGGGYLDEALSVGAPDDAARVVELDTSNVRAKFLNAYYDFDLRALGLQPTPSPAERLAFAAVPRDAARSKGSAAPPRSPVPLDIRAVLPPGLRPPRN
jgi:predicted amidohydrolase